MLPESVLLIEILETAVSRLLVVPIPVLALRISVPLVVMFGVLSPAPSKGLIASSEVRVTVPEPISSIALFATRIEPLLPVKEKSKSEAGTA